MGARLLATDLDRTLLPNGAAPEDPRARPLLAALVSDQDLVLALIEAPPVKAPDVVWSKIRTRIARDHAADPVRDAEPSPMISLGCSWPPFDESVTQGWPLETV